MHLELEVVENQRNNLVEVAFGELTPDDLTDAALRTALFGTPNPLTRQHMGFMAEMPDPLQPLRDADVPDEIVRSLAELTIVDELVGSGRAARVSEFRLGASVGGLRKLKLGWELPRQVYERKARAEALD